MGSHVRPAGLSHYTQLKLKNYEQINGSCLKPLGFLKYKMIYWPLFTDIYTKMRNIQLDNIMITTKLTVFPDFCWPIHIKPTYKEWVKKKHADWVSIVKNLFTQFLLTHPNPQIIWFHEQRHSINHDLLVNIAQVFQHFIKEGSLEGTLNAHLTKPCWAN